MRFELINEIDIILYCCEGEMQCLESMQYKGSSSSYAYSSRELFTYGKIIEKLKRPIFQKPIQLTRNNSPFELKTTTREKSIEKLFRAKKILSDTRHAKYKNNSKISDKKIIATNQFPQLGSRELEINSNQIFGDCKDNVKKNKKKYSYFIVKKIQEKGLTDELFKEKLKKYIDSLRRKQFSQNNLIINKGVENNQKLLATIFDTKKQSSMKLKTDQSKSKESLEPKSEKQIQQNQQERSFFEKKSQFLAHKLRPIKGKKPKHKNEKKQKKQDVQTKPFFKQYITQSNLTQPPKIIFCQHKKVSSFRILQQTKKTKEIIEEQTPTFQMQTYCNIKEKKTQINFGDTQDVKGWTMTDKFFTIDHL